MSTLYVIGGRAFSPGDLSAATYKGIPQGGVASHAELEDNCQACHAPFAGIASERCTACHTTVAREIESGSGLHSRFSTIGRCAGCHREHLGVNADLRQGALTAFDHTLVRFDLRGHQVDFENQPLTCSECHRSGASFSWEPASCQGCHGQADREFIDRHQSEFPGSCLDCHDGVDRMAAMTTADHAQVFPLIGAHETASCAACHTAGRFRGLGQTCEECHLEPEIHQGLFGTGCAACHDNNTWQPALLRDRPFDHDIAATFSLVSHQKNWDESPLTCVTCHTGIEPLIVLDSVCSSCHTTGSAPFMDEHTALFGNSCQTCHDGTGDLQDFDHDRLFPLQGGHGGLQCTDCHQEQQFKGTPAACSACHQEPEFHLGLFGTNCAACHLIEAWQPARLTVHAFPLDHGEQGELACSACHTTSYTSYTCTNCHEHEPAATGRKHEELRLSPEELADCAVCHPAGKSEESDDD